jgi:type IV secretion system protein VirD4
MTTIDPASADFLDRCRDLARMVMARGGGPRDLPWSDAAELVLTAFITYVAACEPESGLRTLTTVKELIRSPENYAWSIRGMQEAGGPGDVIRRLGQQLTWFTGRELGSIMTTVLRHTAWMDSPGAAARLSSPALELRRLRLDHGPAVLGEDATGIGR